MIPLINSFWNNEAAPTTTKLHSTSSEQIYDALARSMSNKVRCGYKTLESAAMTLRVCFTLRLDERLVDNTKIVLFFEELTHLQNSLSQVNSFQETNVLVIEGLGGCGKSTIVKELSKIPGVIAFTNLPLFIQDVCDIFYSMAEPIARAFEYTINYFMVREINRRKPKIAVLDQFYHATCAYPICTEYSTLEEINNLPVSAFDWPLDLPKPHLVIYLLTATDIRLRRRRQSADFDIGSGRSSERIVAKDMRVQRAFELVTGPVTVAVEASGTVDDVVALCVEACEGYSLPLYPPTVEAVPEVEIRKENIYPSAKHNKHNKRMSMGIYGSLSDLNW